MKKLLLLATVFITSTAPPIRAQNIERTASNPSDTIRIEKKSGGNRFFQNNQELKIKQLQEVLKTNESAYKSIKSAKSSNTFATILGSAGGFLIGWPLGTAIGGGKPNWALVGVGAGLVGVSFPLAHSAKKKVRAAIVDYNSTINSNVSTNSKELTFSTTASGLGLTLKF
jgi:hypothetical protein